MIKGKVFTMPANLSDETSTNSPSNGRIIGLTV
jgi:hypothetical protein